jgi:threonine dehydrogenase-like Zn-dependent dehydrogenase
MWTRRQFLNRASRSVVAAASVPTIWSPTAARAANERLGIGVIGVGPMGCGHLGAMLGRGDVQVVTVCDVVQQRLEHAKQRVESHLCEPDQIGPLWRSGCLWRLSAIAGTSRA